MFALQSDFAMTHFEVFDSFFTEMLGSLDSYEEIDTVSDTLKYFYFTITSILLTVSMLNMLISIISETFGRVKAEEKLTTTYERLSIVAEMDYLNEDENDKGDNEYLIYIYNDENEEKEITETEELSESVNSHKKKIQEIQEFIENLSENVKKQLKEQRDKNQEYFKKMKILKD